jgi:hypothetical protein
VPIAAAPTELSDTHDLLPEESPELLPPEEPPTHVVKATVRTDGGAQGCILVFEVLKSLHEGGVLGKACPSNKSEG